jgi:multiple sugar transport system permease protein
MFDSHHGSQLGRRIGLVLLTLIYGVPLLWLVLTSLRTNQDIFASPTNIFIAPQLDAYRLVWAAGVPQALLSSVTIALGTTVLVVLLAAPAAYALCRVSGAVTAVVIGTLIGLQMLPTASSVIPLFRLLASWHLLGSLWGVVIADAALLLPFAIILLRPFFRAVPLELEEAATTDGAHTLTVLWRIVLPLVRNGLITVATFIFIISWGEFLYAVTLLTDPDKYPITALISQQVTQYGVRWNQMMALAVIGAVPVFLIFIATQRRLREGLSMGAVKSLFPAPGRNPVAQVGTQTSLVP